MNPWFRVHSARPQARLRLLCFPHAGGAASMFREWPAFLPPEIEVIAVQYPGREDRIGEPLVSEMGTLVERLADVVGPVTGRPYAFFGHSMGASVAYELALRLSGSGFPDPAFLAVSARKSPSSRETDGESTNLLSDEEICAELVHFGGVDREILANPELRELVLPVVRSDYDLMENYRPATSPRLSCPVLAVIGDQDVVPVADASAWAEVTVGRFDLRVFPGGHFYLQSCLASIADELAARLPPDRG